MEVNVSSRSQSAAAVVAIAAMARETSSDINLINRIATGDKLAMQTLFARHRTFVYRWLLGFVSNETLAEDLLFSTCGVKRIALKAGLPFRHG
jgi:hypothetical protein